jgi:hypothetical protein
MMRDGNSRNGVMEWWSDGVVGKRKPPQARLVNRSGPLTPALSPSEGERGKRRPSCLLSQVERAGVR